MAEIKIPPINLWNIRYALLIALCIGLAPVVRLADSEQWTVDSEQ